MKSNLRYENLRIAMEKIQNEREQEIGEHTWQELVDTYGEAILFAEIASIVSRLKQMFWGNHYLNMDSQEVIDRALDLLIDLGNFAEFFYISLLSHGPSLVAPAEEVS